MTSLKAPRQSKVLGKLMASTATGSKGKAPAKPTTKAKSTAKAKSPVDFPTLDIERSFLSSGVRLLAGVDEVGLRCGIHSGPVVGGGNEQVLHRGGAGNSPWWRGNLPCLVDRWTTTVRSRPSGENGGGPQ